MLKPAREDFLPRISVRNVQRKIAVDVASLQDFAHRALQLSRGLGSPTAATGLERIDVLLISDRRMINLHRRFLGLPGSTDVITFQHGEIFVSVETADRQAREFGTSLPHEIQLYIVHGLLHLRGFDDRSESTARRMATAQKKILEAALA